MPVPLPLHPPPPPRPPRRQDGPPVAGPHVHPPSSKAPRLPRPEASTSTASTASAASSAWAPSGRALPGRRDAAAASARGRNAAGASEATTAAVFVLSFGTDAYALLLASGPEANAAAPKHGRRRFGRLLANRVARSIAELYEVDARRVAVMGVPPLGCTPRVIWEGMSVLDGGACVEEANKLIHGYNASFAAQLEDLRAELPDAYIAFCDVYKGMMEIISNPGRYGTSNLVVKKKKKTESALNRHVKNLQEL